MHDNKHPHGNMAVLICAPDFGLGTSADAPRFVPEAALPKGDVHDTPHPYPLSVPLPGVETADDIKIYDDGTLVRDRMHPGIISCGTGDTLADAAKTMIDKDIHALVVIDAGKAVGVLSQTDIVLARQGRKPDEARGMKVGEVMTAGCATIDASTKLSHAITEMMKRRIHRLLVTENDKPVGVLSMTDIVRRLIG
jgi:crotonyl-CoA carboxylase/reductase